MTRRLRPSACALWLALMGAACTTWQVQTAPVREVAATGMPRARVTLCDGARLQLWDARVEQDSLVGHLTDDTARTAFPIDSVRTIELQRESATETVKMTVIVLFGIAYALLRIAFGRSS